MSLPSTGSWTDLTPELGLYEKDAIEAEGLVWDETFAGIRGRGYQFAPLPGRISSWLGGGVSAQVFLVEKDGMSFAAKVFVDNDVDYFDNENAALKKPGFPSEFGPTRYESFIHQGAQPVLIMEYIRGTPIRDYVNSRGLSMKQTIELIEQLCHGLQRLHQKTGWVHRDLHGKNVFVTDEGTVRLLDLGSAGPTVERNSTVNCRGNRTCSPPEVQRGERRPDYVDEVYNVAAIAIRCLIMPSGLPTTDGNSGAPEILRGCRQLLLEHQAPRPLIGILLGGIKSRKRRYQSVGELAKELREWRLDLRGRLSRAVNAALFWLIVVGLLVWLGQREWRYHAARANYAERLDQANDFPNVQPLLNRVSKDAAQAARVHDPIAMAQAASRLEQAMVIEKHLERKEHLARTLRSTPWVMEAPTIQVEYQRTAGDFASLTPLFQQARASELGEKLDELLSRVATLQARNEDARAVLSAKKRFEMLRSELSEATSHSRNMEECLKDASSAEAAWLAGDFEQAKLLYGSALEQIPEAPEADLLSQNSSPRLIRVRRPVGELPGSRNRGNASAVRQVAAEVDEPRETPAELRSHEQLLAGVVLQSQTRHSGIQLVLVQTPGRTQLGTTPERIRLYQDAEDEAFRYADIPEYLWIGVTEVTRAQFQFAATGTKGNGDGAEYPQTELTFYDAIETCNHLSRREGLELCYRVDSVERSRTNRGSIVFAEVTRVAGSNGFRLPTEAEWEFACRAGTVTDWSFGNGKYQLGDHAWCELNAAGEVHEVATRRANPWGIHDMHGNVLEWIWDRNDTHSPAWRGIRGGSFGTFWYTTRSAFRTSADPSMRAHQLGLRVVRDVVGEELQALQRRLDGRGG